LYRPKKLRQWTPDHLTLLHDACAAGLTDEEIQARLRERFKEEWPTGAIKTKRQKIGLVAKGADLSELLSRRNRKYWPTPEIDETIRRCFARKYQDGGALASAARETGWTKNAVVQRARELGLSHARNEVRWTDAEERLLEELAHQSPQTIQIHLREKFGVSRTLTSIEAKRQRLGLLSNLDGMNLRQLAEALGVAKKTVDRWLSGGWIRGILRFPELQAVNRHVWFFPNAEIRRFIIEHLVAVDLARVEKYWFVDLLTNGKA